MHHFHHPAPPSPNTPFYQAKQLEATSLASSSCTTTFILPMKKSAMQQSGHQHAEMDAHHCLPASAFNSEARDYPWLSSTNSVHTEPHYNAPPHYTKL
jgi:hypothetical protein